MGPGGGARTFPLAVGVGGEGVVDGPHQLVHALHVGQTRVQLGVDEEDPLHHLPVGLAARRQNLVLVRRVQVQGLPRGAHLWGQEDGQVHRTPASDPEPADSRW